MLIVAAVIKTRQPIPARTMIEVWFHPAYSPAVVGVVVAVEFFVGLWLFLLPGSRRSRTAAAALLTVFSVMLALLLTLDDPPSCGCFGAMFAWVSARNEIWFSLGRNLLCLAVIGFFPWTYAPQPASK